MNKQKTKKSESQIESDPESLFSTSLQAKLKDVNKHRHVPTVAFFALVGLFLSSGTGIAFSVIVVLFSLRVDGDLISRILVFSASVVTLLYVLIHLRGSRTTYTVTQHGPPWLYGNHLHASALLLTRLGFAVWIAAIITTSMLVSTIGISFSASIPQQAIYLNLIVCAVGFLSMCLMIYCIEVSKTPFKTALFSKNSFLRGQPLREPDENASLSVSQRASFIKAEAQPIDPVRAKRQTIFSFKKTVQYTDPEISQPVDKAESVEDDFDLAPASPPQPARASLPAFTMPLVSPAAPFPVIPYVPPVPPVPPMPVFQSRPHSYAVPAPARPQSTISTTQRVNSIKRKPVPRVQKLAEIAAAAEKRKAQEREQEESQPELEAEVVQVMSEEPPVLSEPATVRQRPVYAKSRMSIVSLPAPMSQPRQMPVRPFSTKPEFRAEPPEPFEPVLRSELPRPFASHSVSSSISRNDLPRPLGNHSVSSSISRNELPRPLRSHSVSSSISTFINPQPPLDEPTSPKPISLALITNVIKRTSELVPEQRATLSLFPTVPHHRRNTTSTSSMRDTPRRSRSNSTTTAIDLRRSALAILADPTSASTPEADADSHRAADAIVAAMPWAPPVEEEAPLPPRHTIVIHAPDAAGLSRTARRVKKARKADLARQNFSRPIRRPTHRRSFSEYDAAKRMKERRGMVMMRGGMDEMDEEEDVDEEVVERRYPRRMQSARAVMGMERQGRVRRAEEEEYVVEEVKEVVDRRKSRLMAARRSRPISPMTVLQNRNTYGVGVGK